MGLLLASAVLGVACDGAAPPAALSPSDASALLARHRAAFERFEAWAERTASSDATWDDARALDEVAFSPIRRDESIVAAFIARDGGGALALVHPPGAVLDEAARFTRITGGGEIEVALVPVTAGGEAQPCAVLRRRRPLARDATLTVTVAFSGTVFGN